MQPNNPRTPQVNPDISAPQPMQPPNSPHQAANDMPHLPPAMIIKKEKHKVPVLPIVIAIMICLLLVGALTFVFITTQRRATTPSTIQTQTQTSSEAGRVSSDDIDAASKKIDDSLNSINDAADFKTDELTNQTLGL